MSAANKRENLLPLIEKQSEIIESLGWIDATDTYGMYEKYIKPYVSFQKLKRKIKSYDKNRNRRKAK